MPHFAGGGAGDKILRPDSKDGSLPTPIVVPWRWDGNLTLDLLSQMASRSPLLEACDLRVRPRHRPARALRLAPFLQAERGPALRSTSKSGLLLAKADVRQLARPAAGACWRRGASSSLLLGD